jgi:biopolymer transport protein ExbB
VVGFVGELDELEIAKVARAPGFIAAAFASQGPNGQMLAYGEDEENAGWNLGYFGVILKSVTIDGWVVIAILGVMAAISWLVMGAKARYINSVTRANAKFLELFAREGGDLARFTEELAANRVQDFDPSVLYQICAAGIAELSRRSGRASTLRPELSSQAIATIRANLDRIAAYEGQRLNSLMVLLTIAISGGPFLGLLGTVVGVMITFAAIAATGDVNINAIAPGIAAALVATVAGLGVAIPALFGYNYLITRIKDLTTEMHCFIDEFVTRLAEAFAPNTEPRRLAAE